MPYLLQELGRGKFFAEDGTWVADCRDAREFEHTHLALLQGIAFRDRKTQVVLCLGCPQASMYIACHPEDSGEVTPCEICPHLGVSSTAHASCQV